MYTNEELLRAAFVWDGFGELRKAMHEFIIKPLINRVYNPPREVSYRRARKLIKRGELVWFHTYTATGKSRYQWVPKHKPLPTIRFDQE